MVTSTAFPTGVEATTRGSSPEFLMSRPSNLTMTSPTSSPAGRAGPLSSIPATRAPRAEPSPPRLAELAQLVDDRGGRRRRNGKADAHGSAGRRQDGRVDADHLA